MNAFNKVLFILCVTFGDGLTEADALYFPLTGIELSLPRGSINVLKNAPLLALKATPEWPLKEDSLIRYSAEGEAAEGGSLGVREKTGEIWIRNVDKLENNATVIVTAVSTDTNSSARMTIRLVKEPQDACAYGTSWLCFWGSAQYHVKEGDALGPVGPLGAPVLKKLCPDNVVTYELLNATKYFSIKDATLHLTGAPLDRDTLSPGPQIRASVRCTVKGGPSTTAAPYVVDRVITINVGDRNDNAPKAQDKLIHVNLSDPHFVMGSRIDLSHIGGLIITDDDGPPNRYSYSIKRDVNKILTLKCEDTEADHMEIIKTVIICKLYFAKSGVFITSPYCVFLQIDDVTLEPGNGDSTESIEVCLHSNAHDIMIPTPLALTSMHEIGGLEGKLKQDGSSSLSAEFSSEETAAFILKKDKKQNNKMSFTNAPYNNDLKNVKHETQEIQINYRSNISIFKNAARFARVIQPDEMKDVLNLAAQPAFRFDKPSPIFKITEKGGIVYVENTTILETSRGHIDLTVLWSSNNATVSSGKANIRISIRDVDVSTVIRTSKCPSSPVNPDPCSHASTEFSCTRSCGIAVSADSSTDHCEWRPSGLNLTRAPTPFYATCSPHLATCPDNMCDPLEKLQPLLCLQDCVESKRIFGYFTSNGSKRGIDRAVGVCTCDQSEKCSCHIEEKGAKKSANKTLTKIPGSNTMAAPYDPNVSAQKASSLYPCGPLCLTSVVCVPLAVMLTCALIIMRKRRRTSLKSRKGIIISPPLSPSLMSMNNGNGLLQNDSITAETLLIEPHERLLKSEPDPKWEFPRVRLLLETVLGEGEFGRVLRATATDIAGNKGLTTVAVKTLKEDARSTELLALLSEFALLQEVEHPNVIRLLGACTQGRAPLLIIEYAEHGSLRNYLRRSRHLESGVEPDVEPSSPVTSRDILSFAWQISKGMSYLADIKLVHRDLAARNVLLAAGKVCKISDFGLTRDVYEDDAYLKRSKGRVPVKWMAPESLSDHVYTTRSDVWAFGVLVWELVTLGASPYPGVPPQNLYHLLKSGYRMERPENCSYQIYSVMTSCWAEDPLQRPSFKVLSSHWEKLLEQGSEYLELETRAVSNPGYGTEGLEGTESCNSTDTPFQKCHPESDKLDLLWTHPDLSKGYYKKIEDVHTDKCHKKVSEHLKKPTDDSNEKSFEINENSANIDNKSKFEEKHNEKVKFGSKTNMFCNKFDMKDREQILNLRDFTVPPGYSSPKSFKISKYQKPPYENDLSRSTCNLINSNIYLNSPHCLNFSQPNLFQNHYESPVKRGRSYVDMQGHVSPKKSKPISEQITFKFGSHLAITESTGHTTSIM